MQLGTFTEREHTAQGDSLQAKETVDKPLVVLVREHRTGIITKFKPEGGEGVQLDVAVIAENKVYIDVLWMNGAVVDNLAPYLGQAVPIKLVWTPSAKGGNPYISVRPLEGAELAAAQQWATSNPTRFDTERQQRATQAAQFQQQTPQAAPVQQAPAPVAQQPAAAPVAAPQPPASNTGAIDVTDPAVQALLAQIAGGQTPPKA
ncbi:hypothetical protein GCM10010174_69890 [Kutzneria viridogrisea]|uniref:Uncharacterized protein n=1 Tax=Kutzneria viridogrisea TaxID=47990 RepID=A0ABR6BAW7_9PSEU|nr:hypothetical protein [Kutzneria viridogrisea]